MSSWVPGTGSDTSDVVLGARHRERHPAPRRLTRLHGTCTGRVGGGRYDARPMTPLDVADALELARDGGDLDDLCARARTVRDDAWGSVVTYSPKVFIPLTTLCRDVCHYCTFARPPRRGERAYLTIDEVLAIARAGAAAGCREALFTLGDKPELRYRVAREELAELGHPSHGVVPGRGGARGARGDGPAAAREPGHPRRRRARRAAHGRAVAGDHAGDRLGAAVGARHAALRLARQAPGGAARRDRAAPGELRIPYTSGHPDRHRRDAHRARRGAARAARPAPASTATCRR